MRPASRSRRAIERVGFVLEPVADQPLDLAALGIGRAHDGHAVVAFDDGAHVADLGQRKRESSGSSGGGVTDGEHSGFLRRPECVGTLLRWEHVQAGPHSRVGRSACAVALPVAPTPRRRTKVAELQKRLDVEARRSAAAEHKIDELENRVFLLTDQVESQKVASIHRARQPLPVVTLKPDAPAARSESSPTAATRSCSRAPPSRAIRRTRAAHRRAPTVRIVAPRADALADRPAPNLTPSSIRRGRTSAVAPIPPSRPFELRTAASTRARRRAARALQDAPTTICAPAITTPPSAASASSCAASRTTTTPTTRSTGSASASTIRSATTRRRRSSAPSCSAGRRATRRPTRCSSSASACSRSATSTRARQALRELPATYPRTEAARLAAERLAQLVTDGGIEVKRLHACSPASSSAPTRRRRARRICRRRETQSSTQSGCRRRRRNPSRRAGAPRAYYPGMPVPQPPPPARRSRGQPGGKEPERSGLILNDGDRRRLRRQRRLGRSRRTAGRGRPTRTWCKRATRCGTSRRATTATPGAGPSCGRTTRRSPIRTGSTRATSSACCRPAARRRRPPRPRKPRRCRRRASSAAPSGGNGVFLRQTGFVEPGELAQAGKIVGSKEEKLMLGTLDEAYVAVQAGPAVPGRRALHRLHADAEVKHPLTGKLSRPHGRDLRRGRGPRRHRRQDRARRHRRRDQPDRARLPRRAAQAAVQGGAAGGRQERPAAASSWPRCIRASSSAPRTSSSSIAARTTASRSAIASCVTRRGDGYQPLLSTGPIDDRRFPRETIGEIVVVDLRDHRRHRARHPLDGAKRASATASKPAAASRL